MGQDLRIVIKLALDKILSKCIYVQWWRTIFCTTTAIISESSWHQTTEAHDVIHNWAKNCLKSHFDFYTLISLYEIFSSIGIIYQCFRIYICHASPLRGRPYTMSYQNRQSLTINLTHFWQHTTFVAFVKRMKKYKISYGNCHVEKNASENSKWFWTQIFVHTQGGSSCGKRMQSKARFAYLLPTTFKCTYCT